MRVRVLLKIWCFKYPIMILLNAIFIIGIILCVSYCYEVDKEIESYPILDSNQYIHIVVDDKYVEQFKIGDTVKYWYEIDGLIFQDEIIDIVGIEDNKIELIVHQSSEVKKNEKIVCELNVKEKLIYMMVEKVF